MARKRTDWAIVATGAAITLFGTVVTPGVPDAELIGLGIMAYGVGAI